MRLSNETSGNKTSSYHNLQGVVNRLENLNSSVVEGILNPLVVLNNRVVRFC